MGVFCVGDRELPPRHQAVLFDRASAGALAPRVAQSHRAVLASVSAVGKSFYSSEVEDYVHATLETRAGAVGSFEVSWSARNYRIPEIMIEVQGDRGSLTITDDHIEIDADQSLPGIIASGKSILRRADFDTSVPFLLADPEFTVEDEYFLTTVQNRSRAQPDFEAGTRVNEFIDMVHHGMR